MEKFTVWLVKIKNSINKIKLIDKCLIIFMIILMSQSIYNLFVNEANSAETPTIDIIVRTTSASIFGYFLSANFIKKTPLNPKNKYDNVQSQDTTISTKSISSVTKKNNTTIINKNKIGFRSNSIDEIKESENTNEIYNNQNEILSEVEDEYNHQQIIIATIIGVVSLLAIIIARNFTNLSPTSDGSISQLRDFVSGCVGFLLGMPNTSSK